MYKILLVEDDKALRFIYSKMKVWSKCGFVISQEATDGKMALEILQNNQFDLIVTDIRMPFIDGIEFLRKIRHLNINTCVIFISSYDEFEYARQGLILGAFDYILKPIKEKQLKEVLERVKKYLIETSENMHIISPVLKALKYINVDLNESNFIKQVCLCMSTIYENIFTMEDIALSLNLNKDYFGKVFKQHTNVTFNHFYSIVKVEYSKELLSTGNYTIYQISELLGYSSVDYFTKIFKDITGETPSKFKAN